MKYKIVRYLEDSETVVASHITLYNTCVTIQLAFYAEQPGADFYIEDME